MTLISRPGGKRLSEIIWVAEIGLEAQVAPAAGSLVP